MKKLVEIQPLAQFDCKVWDAKNFNNVFAYLLWRQIDCVKNSKQQAAQTYLSHKQLMNKSTDDQVKMLLDEKGINWNNYANGKKYGRFIYKEEIVKKTPNGDICKRNVWLAHDAFPLFEEGGKQKLLELGKIPIKIIESESLA